jgi:RNA polymerase sigma factor FliA
MSRRVDAAEQELANRLARMPSSDELAEAAGTTIEELQALRDRVFRSVVLTLDYRSGTDEPDMTLGDMLFDRTQPEPEEEMESRELLAYLRDAVRLLPERHRLVIVGYFLDGRTSDELARLLGVTESRVSQLRSEALQMLREGIEAQYTSQSDTPETSSRVARRKTAYASAISTTTRWQDRLTRAGQQVPIAV